MRWWRAALNRQWVICVSLAAVAVTAAAVPQQLEPVVNRPAARVMTYDWPILRVATGEYREGPTGVTVIHFDKKVNVAVDARGGGPGTVNAEYMKLGYDAAELDAVVFAGGSWYGLEAVTAVASALKDEGIRDGDAFSVPPNIAMSVGSIIFDFGARRLNEIYPDKRLAQAVLKATRSGEFPLGAVGAGRFAMSGWLFGCNAYSGQGGAFRQIGKVKIAAFTVANPLGVITDRAGHIAACYGEGGKEKPPTAADLLAQYVQRLTATHDPAIGREVSAKNTTVSLVVTNQKLTPAELQRLAVQVHTSMARGIQPFATIFDGDVLYAVSTAELEQQLLQPHELGTIAAEVMWDALLSSVPEQPPLPQPAQDLTLAQDRLQNYAGEYRFSPRVSLQIRVKEGRLLAQASGDKAVYAIGREHAVALQPVSATDFTLPGRYPLLLRFDGNGRLLINPGHWQQLGRRI